MVPYIRSRLIVATMLVASGVAAADIPKLISYRGRITDTDGVPVVDANYTMRFRLFDAESAGLEVWDSGDVVVAVHGGVFEVRLGESRPLDLAFDGDLWLQVTFSGVVQSPRVRLTSTGYAFMASGLIAGTKVTGTISGGGMAALSAQNTAASGATFGLAGSASSGTGIGVAGTAGHPSGPAIGV